METMLSFKNKVRASRVPFIQWERAWVLRKASFLIGYHYSGKPLDRRNFAIIEHTTAPATSETSVNQVNTELS